MDMNQDGLIDTNELWRYLHNNQADIQYQVQRLVVKHHSEWLKDGMSALWQAALDEQEKSYPELALYNKEYVNKLVWMKDVPEIRSSEALWHMHPVVFLDALNFVNTQCYCYKQGIVDSPCQSGRQDITKENFEVLSDQLGIEREVLRAIAVAETGDKIPFKQYVSGVKHATILYERHFMKRLSLVQGISPETVHDIESTEPNIIHSYDSSYRHGLDSEQYERLLRAREINYDAANMSCSWGGFQVMGEYYHHLYESTKELVDAQNYCALQHLQYFKVFLVEEKRMLQPMRDKDWLSIARKYNGTGQIGYDEKIKNAYDYLKDEW
ncbi:N-acetylmuramidase domain-containing protein [Buttiauxella ferragutiae]|uniref:N-acetylmuramidase domain-containing protein n=1 Tax=Buttiauxella ferragutiae TaxID=82989 RepID=UPI001E5E1360|nr:N-acetylmuramidase domain-containing protein [Buttiauxella ferragutiae]